MLSDRELAVEIASVLSGAGGLIAYAHDNARGPHIEIIVGPDEAPVCLFIERGGCG